MANNKPHPEHDPVSIGAGGSIGGALSVLGLSVVGVALASSAAWADPAGGAKGKAALAPVGSATATGGAARWNPRIAHRNSRYAFLGRESDQAGDARVLAQHEVASLRRGLDTRRSTDTVGDRDESVRHALALKGREGVSRARFARSLDLEGDLEQAHLAGLTRARHGAQVARLAVIPSEEYKELARYSRDLPRFADALRRTMKPMLAEHAPDREGAERRTKREEIRSDAARKLLRGDARGDSEDAVETGRRGEGREREREGRDEAKDDKAAERKDARDEKAAERKDAKDEKAAERKDAKLEKEAEKDEKKLERADEKKQDRDVEKRNEQEESRK